MTAEPIRRIALESGKVRYRLVVDLGRRPNGSRHQHTSTHDTLKAAREQLARVRAGRADGTLVRPDAITLAQHLDDWLAGKREIRPTTRDCYRVSLLPVREQLGAVRLQHLRKSHVDGLISYLQTSGRRNLSGNPRGVSARTVRLSVGVLAQALDDAMKQGLVVRNVARLVDLPSGTAKEMKTWTEAEVSTFLAKTSGDRLRVVFLLSLLGLRRGEVAGLRWSSVDLEAGTLAVRDARVTVQGQVHDSDPKTDRGRRTLPLDAGLVAELRSLKRLHAAEQLAAGPAYEDSGLVARDELGRGYRPEYLSDRFQATARAAGVPVIRLHDARHTAATLLHLRGVPMAVVSAWLGHADAAFTLRTYAHSQPAAMADAGAIFGAMYSAV